MGQGAADLERQVLNVVRAHIELKNLEAGSPCLVVEVVNLEQVNLIHIAVTGVNLVQPPLVTVLPVNDGLRLEVQGVGITVTHAEQGVQDGVIKAKTIEPDHPSVRPFEPHHKVNDGLGVIAPRAYLKCPLQGCITMLDCHREYIGISFQIPAVVITHYIYRLGGGTRFTVSDP